MQLEPEVQGRLIAYFGALPTYNRLIEKIDENELERIRECNKAPDSQELKNECNDFHIGNRAFENEIARGIYEISDNLLNDFHPTQDRLKSPWLKLLMGSKSTKFLSRE